MDVVISYWFGFFIIDENYYLVGFILNGAVYVFRNIVNIILFYMLGSIFMVENVYK